MTNVLECQSCGKLFTGYNRKTCPSCRRRRARQVGVYRRLRERDKTKRDTPRTCYECGKEYLGTPRQQLCDECMRDPEVHERRQANRDRRKRELIERANVSIEHWRKYYRPATGVCQHPDKHHIRPDYAVEITKWLGTYSCPMCWPLATRELWAMHCERRMREEHMRNGTGKRRRKAA